jgi:hypothetical protein
LSSQSELYQEWLAYMQAVYPGYVPAPANPENVQALGIAAIMADAVQTGVVVPPAIVRNLGTKLFGVAYQQGTPAIAVIQVTAIDTAGHTIEAGKDLTLGIYGFATQADLIIPAGSSTGTVTVVATQPGSDPNGAMNPTSFVSIIDWVIGVTALAPASGGVEPESDDAYQTRLVSQLRLRAPRPITASDFATMSFSFPPAAGTDQQLIGRATALDGYVKAGAAFVVAENSTTTLTVTTPPGTGIVAAQGATITGTNIPSNTIVNSATSGTIVMSKPATTSASGVTATVGGTLGNERTETVGVTLADGTATNTDTKAALALWLESFRELNFDVDVIDPTYTTVYVTVSVHLFPGFDPAATISAIQAAVVSFLSPTNFGLPPFGNQAAWLNGTTIYASVLSSIIQNAAGGAVQYIVDGSLRLGTAPAPAGIADLTIPGPIALPQSSTGTVAVTVV